MREIVDSKSEGETEIKILCTIIMEVMFHIFALFYKLEISHRLMNIQGERITQDCDYPDH